MTSEKGSAEGAYVNRSPLGGRGLAGVQSRGANHAKVCSSRTLLPASHAPCAARRSMTEVLSLPVLVLNRYLVPVQVTTVKRAVVLLYGGVALAIDEGGDSYDFDL